MRKIIFVLIICMFSVSLISQASAYMGPIQKLGRGFKDLVTAPSGYLTETSNEVSISNDKLTGVLVGVIKGTDHMIRKGFGGLINILTFPIENE